VNENKKEKKRRNLRKRKRRRKPTTDLIGKSTKTLLNKISMLLTKI
jgi:hypothetical protein